MVINPWISSTERKASCIAVWAKVEKHKEQIVYLPQLQLCGNIQLSETSHQVNFQGIGIVKVDALGLVGVLAQIGEVITQDVAESPELILALIAKTEVEG